jgi:hypothetical protein
MGKIASLVFNFSCGVQIPRHDVETVLLVHIFRKQLSILQLRRIFQRSLPCDVTGKTWSPPECNARVVLNDILQK